jgi:uncharacterized protein (UPF0333 family)
MKHILNDLSEQEKNSIREQHTGGMKVMTENFSKLISSKLGDVKPMVNEQSTSDAIELYDDAKETKLVDAVSVSGKPKRVGFDKNKLEFSATVVGKNITGKLQLVCDGTRKFYFYDKTGNVIVSGYNKKSANSFCTVA